MAKRIPTVGIIGLGFGRAHLPAFQANGAEVVAICQRDQATARAVADKYGVPRGLRALAGPPGAGAARHRRDRVPAPPASRHCPRRVRWGRPRAVREAARDDGGGGARHGGGGRSRRAGRHDVLQLALPGSDAALPRHGRGRPRRPALPHRRALARRAVGGRGGARDVAHGSRPGGARRDGRHGGARDRSPAVEFRGDRPRDGRRGDRVSIALGAGSGPARGRRGLLHRDRGARLRAPAPRSR